MDVTALVARARTLATTALTWLTIAALVTQDVIARVGDEWPPAAEYGGRVLAVVLFLIAMIRRVTPVEDGDRGLLPLDQLRSTNR